MSETNNEALVDALVKFKRWCDVGGLDYEAALAAATKRAEDLQATITRIAEAQRQHCTTECIDGVWWAKGNGIVAGPQVTEQEVLLEVAEMGIAAAEQENARLREGIQEMLRYYPVVSGDWVSSNLAALLAQPEGGE